MCEAMTKTPTNAIGSESSAYHLIIDIATNHLGISSQNRIQCCRKTHSVHAFIRELE